jgi:hypothetical protein
MNRQDKEMLALMGGYFAGIMAFIIFIIVMFPPR